MNPLMQISEVSVKVCFVGRPRQSINPRGGVAFEGEERHLALSKRRAFNRGAASLSGRAAHRYRRLTGEDSGSYS
jgi:hypothetical protein